MNANNKNNSQITLEGQFQDVAQSFTYLRSIVDANEWPYRGANARKEKQGQLSEYVYIIWLAK